MLRVLWKLPSTLRFSFLFHSFQAAPFRLQLMTTTTTKYTKRTLCAIACYGNINVVPFSYIFQASLQSKCRDHNLNVTQVFRSVLCFDTSNKFVISGCIRGIRFVWNSFRSLDFSLSLSVLPWNVGRRKVMLVPDSIDSKKRKSLLTMFVNLSRWNFSSFFCNYTL